MSGKSNDGSSVRFGSDVSGKARQDLPVPNLTEQPPLSIGYNLPEENPNTSTIPSQPTPHHVLPSKGEEHQEDKTPQMKNVSRQERRRLEREKAKFKAPPLNVENVVAVLEGLTLESVCDMLFIPDTKLEAIKGEFTTDKEHLRAAVMYWLLRDPSASWRRLILQLDHYSSRGVSKATAAAAIANSISNYAEKLTDPSFTCQSVLAALQTVWDRMDSDIICGSLESILNIPLSKKREVRMDSTSTDQYREKLIQYYIMTNPNASWDGLAGMLLLFDIHTKAFEKVKRNIIRTKRDSSLTLTNLTPLMDTVWNNSRLNDYLNIPNTVRDRQDSNRSTHTEATCKWYLNNHLSPSWEHVANALYCSGNHEALEVLRSHYLKGSSLSRRLCDEAMKSGKVESKISKIVIFGAGGSGKSSFMDMVIGKLPPEIRRSTPMACRPVSMYHVNMTHKKWVKLSPEERMRVLARATMGAKHQLDEVCSDSEDGSNTEEVQTEVQVNTNPVSGMVHTTEKISTTEFSHQQLQDAPSTTDPTPTTQADHVSQPAGEATLHSIENLVGMIDKFSESDEALTSFHKLQIIDSGGQPQFHEILPKFLRRMTLYVFVFKLSEELETKPVVEYYNESGERIGTPYQSSQTHEQLMKHCLRTMHSHRSKTKSDGRCSKVMVIGTHLDQEFKSKESQEEKNKKLGKLLLPTFKDEVIYYQGKFIFPVNAKIPGAHEEDLVKDIHRLILTECSPQSVDVPLQYYGLELLLEEVSVSLGRGVLSVEECLEVARKLHFDEHTLGAALQFLDENMSVVFYFPEILESVVFTDPQVLLDKVTELVETVYCLRNEDSSFRLFGASWQIFRDHGRFSLGFLSNDRFKKHYVPGLFTPKELVKLFSKLLIIAEFSGSEYFMPALLPVLEDKKVTEYRVSGDSPAAALALDFPLGAPRLGTYCTLSCFLVTHDNQFPCPWEIELLPDSNTPVCLYRNCIQFSVPGFPGSVTLIDTFNHFEVHVSTASKVCRKLCTYVRQAILTGVRKAAVSLGYNNCTPSAALLCPCGVSDPHVARFSEGMWICSKNKKMYGELTPPHLMWQDQEEISSPSAVSVNIPQSQATTTTTSSAVPFSLANFKLIKWKDEQGHRHIYRLLDHVSMQWKEMGIMLDITVDKLNAWDSKHRGDVTMCWGELMEHWKNSGSTCKYPPSWEGLHELLCDIKYSVAAEEIKKAVEHASM